MNERIKELARQARLFNANGDVSTFIWLGNVEEFAELIVRECAALSRYDSKRVCEHFGVKP
jgi:hypothetical protein